MLKKPVFVSILCLLFISPSNYGYADHRPGHKEPGGLGGGGGKYEVYIGVGPDTGFIEGDVWDTQAPAIFEGGDGKNPRNITTGGGRPAPDTPVLDLGSIMVALGGSEDCFPGGVIEGSYAAISQAKDGSARFGMAFEGFGMDGVTPVTYRFRMFGQFLQLDNWPPSTENPQNTVILTSWDMTLLNSSKKKVNDPQNKACVGSQDEDQSGWTIPGQQQTIDIVRTN